MGRYSLRERLWLKDSHCYWCRRPTRLVIPANHETTPDDTATVDHLYSKLDERRQERDLGIIRRNKRGELQVIRKVIACYACNQARGRIECKLTKADKHLASTRAGLPLSNHAKRDKRHLHEQPYHERKRRLKRLKDRVEEGIEGLISVMGLPLTNYLDNFVLQQSNASYTALSP